MNAGNGMVAFLSWLLAVLRGSLWPICPQLAWPARLGLGDFSPQLPLCIPGVPVPSAVCSGPHPWLVATCSVGQSWLSVLIVLLLLSIPRRKMGSAQPSPQRSNRHTPLPVFHMILVVIHPCG